MNTSSLLAEREHLASLLTLCAQSLSDTPDTADFEAEFPRVCAAHGALNGGAP